MRKKSFQVMVYRYNPGTDIKPYYSKYEVEIKSKVKVLDVLKYIYRNYDSEVAFRSSCGIGRCGSCAVRVNGKPVLACKEYIENQDIIIEPLANYPVIKDLIIDREPYNNRLKYIRPFLERLGWDNYKQAKLEEYRQYEYLSKCIECLSCMSSCPAFSKVPHEFYGPSIFTQLAKYKAHPADGGGRALIAMYGGLHDCTSCKSCKYICPQDIDTFRKAIIDLRASNAQKGRGVPKMQRVFVDELKAKGKIYNPHGRPFTDIVEEVIEGPKVIDEIGLFLGCFYNQRMQKQAEVLIKLLVALGYRIIIPKEQQCCGGPLIWTGQQYGMEKQLRHNIGAFEKRGIKQVVAPCPGCGMTLKQDYPELYATMTGQKPHFTVMDVCELLNRSAIKYLYTKKLRVKVTYHDPCHLWVGQDIWGEPRKIIRSIPGVEFIEMKDANRCCGGMAISANKALAEQLAMDKAQNIIATNAEAVVTSCPNCYDNIRKALIKSRKKLPVYMITDILDLAIG